MKKELAHMKIRSEVASHMMRNLNADYEEKVRIELARREEEWSTGLT